MQMQLQLQRQQQLQHQLYHQNHPQHTMTINRKIINDKPQNIYNEDNPPPLPPLRNPAKAIPMATIPQGAAVTSQITTVSNSDSVQAIPSLNTPDNSIYERDKAIYICSTLRNPNQMKSQTTFNATPATNTKPLPSIINCPLPEIPKEAQQNGPREEIYVKRKFLDQNSKFATLKAIPLPKIDAIELEQQRKKMESNKMEKTEKTEVEAFPEPPPPQILNEDDKKLIEKDQVEEMTSTVTSTTTTTTNSTVAATASAANDESSFYAVTEL